MKYSGKVDSGPMNKWLNLVAIRITVLLQGLFCGFVTILGDTESGTTDCTARCCSAGHAPAGIVIPTITTLCHQPTTDVPWWRYALEVSVLLAACVVSYINDDFVSAVCRRNIISGLIQVKKLHFCIKKHDDKDKLKTIMEMLFMTLTDAALNTVIHCNSVGCAVVQP